MVRRALLHRGRREAGPTIAFDRAGLERIAGYTNFFGEGKRRIVVYTALFGDYDELLPVETPDSNADYVCFSDMERETCGVWKIVPSPFYHPDPVRMARYVKLHPFDLFPDYEWAMWVDGNLSFKESVSDCVRSVEATGSQVAMIPHKYRDCVYGEALECLRCGKGFAGDVVRQVLTYLSEGIPGHGGMYETNCMIMNLKNSDLEDSFSLWWQQVERYSCRDQIALGHVLHARSLRIFNLLPRGISACESPCFDFYHHEEMKRLSINDAITALGARCSPSDPLSFSAVREERLASVANIRTDIIVCVHNALEDVQQCLASVRDTMTAQERIIIVNDCSNEEMSTYLRSFSRETDRTILLENRENLGYTKSANRGLGAAKGDFHILLNSDTIVAPQWVAKLAELAFRSRDIGIVGPLSNAAGLQSVPGIKSSETNTAINELPRGWTVERMDRACEELSCSRFFPIVPLVHGFCYGIKRDVIEKIGCFDEDNFQRFYGEENDYSFRALRAGFRLAIATHTFVFHRKSASISIEDRLRHMEITGRKLSELYGTEYVEAAVMQLKMHPILERMRRGISEFF
jgi:GT2 family glycosyltransferase